MASGEENLRRELQPLIDRINAEADVVIVEGSKDESALRSAGVTVDVVTYARTSIWLTTHRLRKKGYEDVLILTDFDEKGREYNAKLRERLEGRITVLGGLRKEVGKVLTQTGRRDIESLNNLYSGEPV